MIDTHSMKSVDDGGAPWRDKHPGVPKAWTGIGSGGNAIVWFDGTVAIKRLHPHAASEAIARFAREAELVTSLREEPGLALVHVYEVRQRASATEIVMEKLDGNLDDVIQHYGGQPSKAALSLLPIVETLHRLAVREHPIHHRDIKPSNLLYSQSAQEIELFLADFGCAHLAGDERLTPTNRAVGAWAYRPPEYSVGRVEDVSEKGDVFCLGKVLWSMINGERGIVFPGPVWYLEEFDLAGKFPQAAGIGQAMLAVAGAVNVRPEKRPSLAQFAEMLRAIGTYGSTTATRTRESTALLRAEAQIEVEYQQRRAFTATFVRSTFADLRNAIDHLHASTPESVLFAAWHDEAQKSPQTAAALVEQVAVHESDAPIVNVRFRRFSFTSRFHPQRGHKPASLIVRLEHEDGKASSLLTVMANPASLMAEWQHHGEAESHREQYRPEHILTFLETAAPLILGAKA